MKYWKKLGWISLSSFFLLGIVISTAHADDNEDVQCDPSNEESVCL